MSIGNRISDYVFQNVLNQPEHRAHYGSGTLFYEEKDLKMNEDSTKYDTETTSLGDFIAEFSHHINRDWELRRSFAYAEDLVRKGFQQQQMYGDLFSSEYQAHSVTQTAIAKYLFPDNNDLNVDFVNLYNTEQEYYREFIKVRGYEKSEDIEDLTFDLLQNKKFEDIVKDKIIIFQNLEEIRNLLDVLEVSNNLKGDLFSIMINSFPLEKSNNNYHLIVEKSTELGEVLELREVALRDPSKISILIENLEEKYKNDKDYVYASVTKRIFDDDMMDKIDSNLDYNQIIKAYKLYIYGLTKGIEGSGIGYKNANEYPVQWAYEKYESYLTKAKKEVRKEVLSKIENNAEVEESLTSKLSNTKEELTKIEIDKYLSYALEYYLKKDISGLKSLNEKIIWELSTQSKNEIESIIERLQKGLEENGSPDLERDFFDDGRSPLLMLLK